MLQGDAGIDPEAAFVSAPDFVFLGVLEICHGHTRLPARDISSAAPHPKTIICQLFQNSEARGSSKTKDRAAIDNRTVLKRQSYVGLIPVSVVGEPQT
jgi:hypothetical protein